MADFQDITEAAPGSFARVLRVRAATVDVTAGPDAGRSARVEQASFVIGSSEGCDLRLSDSTVSRAHLRVSATPEGVWIRDEGSKNGVWVGGIRLTEATLTASTTLSLGTTTLSLRVDAAPTDVPLSVHERFGGAIGASAAMRHVFAVLERAAPSEVTVLVEGESGVGKDLLARAVHDHSPRAQGPFVVVDCGAMASTLVESELFGHERGSFTGAVAARAGVFREAEGGTLFLDEIGELTLDLQAKLLRVLEAREIRPVGGDAPHAVDVRIVAATNRRLAQATQAGEFRKDLFYRLAVARVVVPPLRDRREDVLPLARALLRSTLADDEADLPDDFSAMLLSYHWPGNVRELRNVIERYALLGMRSEASLFDDSGEEDPPGDDLSHLPYAKARRVAVARFEREYLPRVLERAGGVVARAAELAEVARPSFHRMLQRVRKPDGPHS